MPESPYVALAMPRRGGISEGAAQGYYLWPMRQGSDRRLAQLAASSSLLNHCFNVQLAAAMKYHKKLGVTHFAMIHSDITPDHYWVDTLLDELIRVDGDVMSAVVAMKDGHGLTSTALATSDPWEPRRLTLKEIHDLPETFGTKDVGAPLLLNTGLWVFDMTKPVFQECLFNTDTPLCFNSMERIVPMPDDEYEAQVISEDWLFSYRLNQMGANLYATRKVRTTHDGEIGFSNDKPWGAWHRDEKHAERVAAKSVTGNVLSNGHAPALV